MNKPKIRFKSFNGEFLSDTLGNLGDFYSGLSGKKGEDFIGGNDEFITYMNVHKNFIANRSETNSVSIKSGERQNCVTKGDIVFTQSSETPDEVGLCSLWPYEDSVYLNSFCFGYRLRDKSRFNPRFITYQLRSPKYRRVFYKEAQGISRYNISPSRVGNILIAVPERGEQKKVAIFFSTLDEKISLFERKLEALERLKKGLMQMIFSQTLRFRSSSGTSFPSWSQILLGDCGKIITGKTPPTNEKSNYDGEIPFCSPSDLGADKYISKTEKSISHSGAQFANIIPKNSILITCIGSTIGKLGIAAKDMATNQQINSLIVNNEYCNEFVYYAINFNFREFMKSVGTQAVPIINKSSLSRQAILIPVLEEQHLIVNLLSSLDRKIDLTRTEVKLLRKIKQGFLQQMFV